MRVLILTTVILACARAAPSVLSNLTPVAVAGIPTIPAVAIPSVVPTISPGDIQAAAIDAKVEAENQARALNDQAILLESEAKIKADLDKEQAELAAEMEKEKLNVETDSAKAKSDEAFWSNEDKKWQTYDAVNTAEAQLDGVIARNADVLAKAAVGGIVYASPAISNYAASGIPTAYVASGVPSAFAAPAIPNTYAASGIPTAYATPFAAPISPIVYATPGIVAPLAKTAEKEAKPEEAKTQVILKAAEDKPVEGEKPVEAGKLADPLSPNAEIKTDNAQIQILTATRPLIGAPLLAPTVGFGGAWIAPVAYIQPELNGLVQPVQTLQPTLKTFPTSQTNRIKDTI